MKKKYRIIVIICLVFIVLKANAQNANFNNVSIGTDGPAYGVKIKANFPGYTGGWARFFSVSNDVGDQNYIALGTYGDMRNGITGFNRSYIGKDWNNTYIDFLSNGNIGIGTQNPSSKLSVLGGISKLTLTGIDGTFDNVIKYGYKSDLESGTSYANRWHGIDGTITAGSAENNKLKFRLYPGGFSNAIPVDVLTLQGNGNVGIGTVNPTAKLEVSNGAFKVGTEEKRNFTITFPNETSNLATDIIFGNSYINGFIEVEITSSYNYQNSVGIVKKIFSVGGNPNGAMWNLTSSRVVEAEGEISKNFTIGDFSWDAAKSSYKITINHIVKTQNTLFVSIKYSSVSSFSNPLLEKTLITSPYTTVIQSNYSTPQAVFYNGNVGIGTSNPTSKLTVAGNINSREVKVSVDAGADFVFEKDYALPSLQEVEKFVTENKHLPEIASAKEMQKEGINLSEMNIKLLQKIEELTLYLIQQQTEIEELKKDKQSLRSLAEKVLQMEKKIK